jgi:glycosyltransferase involved in cell wall biosynthesis
VRIARVLTRLNLGGPARQVLASDPLLASRGHEVRVFAGRPAPGEGDLFDVLQARGLDVVRVPGLARGLGPADVLAGRTLRRCLREFGPDLVHTHASKAGVLGRRAAWGLPGVRTVHTFHGHVLEGYFTPLVSRILLRIETSLAARTDRIVAVSHATGDDLIRLGVVAEERLTVIPPGIELGPLLVLPGRSNHLLVGVVGRLAEVKRPGLALEVFELLCERYPRLHLCFVGDGDQRRSLERRILGGPEAVTRRVHLVGAQPNMVAVMADLDVVLSTSRSEGMPVALIEAAAAGKPVVATGVGGVPELVAHERTGYLGQDVDELAYGLAQLLDDADLAQDMGHRARLRVAQRHSAEALTDRLEGLYRAVLEEVPCAS